MALSDPKSVIESLKNRCEQPNIIVDCQKWPLDISRTTSLSFDWIPGRQGFQGNELADLLVKRAGKNKHSATSFVPLPLTSAKEKINSMLWNRWDAIWRKSSTGLWTEILFPSVYSFNINTQSYQVIQVLTGHGKFNSYLFKFKKIESPICMWGTTEHFLFYCSSFNNERLIF